MKETETRPLQCTIGPEDLSTKALNASHKRHRASKLREEASSLDKEAKLLEAEVATGVEVLDVDCAWELDLESSKARLTRQDDREVWPDGKAVVEERDLTEDERQQAAGEHAGRKARRAKNAH